MIAKKRVHFLRLSESQYQCLQETKTVLKWKNSILIVAFFQRAVYDDLDKLLYAIFQFSRASLIWLQNWRTMNKMEATSLLDFKNQMKTRFLNQNSERLML
jgi:hypothetical protein